MKYLLSMLTLVAVSYVLNAQEDIRVYNYIEEGYTISLPAEWNEIPIDYVMKRFEEQKVTEKLKDYKFNHGYSKRGPTDWYYVPYILSAYTPYSSDLYKDIEYVSALMTAEATKALIENTERPESYSYDSINYIIKYIHSAPNSEIASLATEYFTKRGGLEIVLYCNKEDVEIYLPQYNQIVSSVIINKEDVIVKKNNGKGRISLETVIVLAVMLFLFSLWVVMARVNYKSFINKIKNKVDVVSVNDPTLTNVLHCSICGETKKIATKKNILYGEKVCTKCFNGFASRRQSAYLIDAFILGIASRLVGIFYPDGIAVFVIILLLLFLFKEGYSGASLGKYITGLLVVDKTTGEPISLYSSFKRTLPLNVPFMPIIVAFDLKKGYRIGDGWANSKVVWKKYFLKPPFKCPFFEFDKIK